MSKLEHHREEGIEEVEGHTQYATAEVFRVILMLTLSQMSNVGVFSSTLRSD